MWPEKMESAKTKAKPLGDTRAAGLVGAVGAVGVVGGRKTKAKAGKDCNQVLRLLL